MIKSIWHISDTHALHKDLIIPENIDLVIHSGDASNYKDIYKNEQELRNFIIWYSRLPIKYKIFVAGNHETSLEKRLITKEDFTKVGIIYLENESVEIEGIKIWGSPHTPTFGNWSFMKPRNTINRVWDSIPIDTDILVIHGPAKNVLDLSYDREGTLEFCGCSALKKAVLKLQPKLFLFGHVHNFMDITNAGTTKLANCRTIFSNGSVVTDNKFGELSSNGNIIEYENH